jgi:hypothetical protein
MPSALCRPERSRSVCDGEVEGSMHLGPYLTTTFGLPMGGPRFHSCFLSRAESYPIAGIGEVSSVVALEQFQAVSFWGIGSGDDRLIPPLLRSRKEKAGFSLPSLRNTGARLGPARMGHPLPRRAGGRPGHPSTSCCKRRPIFNISPRPRWRRLEYDIRLSCVARFTLDDCA